MSTLDDAILKTRKVLHKDHLPAVLGDGTGQPRAGDGLYWVRKVQAAGVLSTAFKAPLAPGVSLTIADDVPIELGYDTRGNLCIYPVNADTLNAANISPYLQNPLEQAVYDYVSTDRLALFLCRRHNDTVTKPLTVIVLVPFVLISATLTPPTLLEIDFTGNVPAAGLHCYAVVCWKTDNTLEAKYSTAKSTGDPLTEADLQEALITRTSGAIPVWAWALGNAQSALTADASKQVDLRQWITSDGGVSEHNNLPGLQGGTAGEYYHLSATQWNSLPGITFPLAPIDATYITQTPNALLSNEQAMSALATGLVNNTTGTGVQTVLAPGSAGNFARSNGSAWQSISHDESLAISNIVGGRLTLSSTLPDPSSDLLAQGTLYYLPFVGNKIGLWHVADSRWKQYTIPDAGVSLSLASLTRATDYSVFIYDNAGTLTLDTEAWTYTANGNISSITNASPPVVSYSSGPGVPVGGTVAINGNAQLPDGLYRVSAIGGGTFTIVNLNNSAVAAPGASATGGTYVRWDARNTAPTFGSQNGIVVKDSAPERRYIGHMRINPTAANVDLSVTRRGLANFYNRVPYGVFWGPATASWTYATSAWRAANNDYANRVEFVTAGVQVSDLLALGFSSGNSGTSALALDSAPNGVGAVIHVGHNTTTALPHIGVGTDMLARGFHWAYMVEYRSAGTVTFYGTNSDELIQAGIRGKINL